MSLSADRPPVSTYEQAVWWLVCHSRAVSDFIENSLSLDDMPLEAVLVCDLFWVTREQLRVRLCKAFREVSTAPAPLPRRRGGPAWVSSRR